MAASEEQVKVSVLPLVGLAALVVLVVFVDFRLAERSRQRQYELAERRKLAVSMQRFCSTYYKWREEFKTPLLDLDERCLRAEHPLSVPTDR